MQRKPHRALLANWQRAGSSLVYREQSNIYISNRIVNFLQAAQGAGDPMVTTGAILLVVVAFASTYALAELRRRKGGGGAPDELMGFRPRIGFTRLDGMVSLSLLLDNESSEHVWAEEIEIYLSDLRAEQQASEAPCHGTRKIRQMVRSDDMLPISLCETIYLAAGSPQRKYSCALSSVLRYRIGEKSFEKQLDNYRIRMAGLTASGIHRERRPVPSIPARDESRDTVPAMAGKLK
jgi:hypothetical protein